MLKLTILAVIIAAVAASNNIRFTDCGHHEISDMQFSGCNSDDTECKVHKGADVTYSTHFTANQDTSSVKVEMFASLGGIEIPVPGLKSNGCDGHVKCPLVKGEKYTFNYSFTLPKIIPNVHVTVIAKLIGQNGELACARMAGVVVDN